MGKRFISLLCVFVFLFTSLTLRCAYIAFSNTYSVSDTYNSYSVEIGKLHPNIYDRLGKKLNNNSVSYTAVIRPNEKCLSELDKLYNTSQIKEITEELSHGYPITADVFGKADTKHIQIFERINQNSPDMLCRHLLDYQCGGLESYIEDEIGSLYVNFPVDAMGRLLGGDNFEVINNDYDSAEGVVISIDSRIQSICEEAAKSISKGAVVVMDTKTSQLLASVSMGNDYNNRALSSYAIGSVFKLVVCACALENGINSIYSCNGSIKVYDTLFTCQKDKKHGLQDMKSALANSCNCYFVNLALRLGSEKLCNTARSLGFGNSFTLYDGWTVKGGNMPTLSTLSSAGQLALLGFGQGQLTDSPAHFASVVACIANSGNYSYPSIGFSDNKENKVLSDKTCKTILDYMHYVVMHGTGTAANYNDNTGGKTATAQSGIYINGVEQLNTYFAGVYPAVSPEYAIVVMCEGGSSGAQDCCPVFRAIVEKLEKL